MLGSGSGKPWGMHAILKKGHGTGSVWGELSGSNQGRPVGPSHCAKAAVGRPLWKEVGYFQKRKDGLRTVVPSYRIEYVTCRTETTCFRFTLLIFPTVPLSESPKDPINKPAGWRLSNVVAPSSVLAIEHVK